MHPLKLFIILINIYYSNREYKNNHFNLLYHKDLDSRFNVFVVLISTTAVIEKKKLNVKSNQIIFENCIV